MRRIIMASTVCLVLSACSDDKKQEKAALDQVLSVHDKVMGNDEAVMKNKMQLDTLLKLKPNDSVEIKALSVKLTAAEDSMDSWMHQFEPDVTGKSQEQIITYYESQKKQVIAVDSLLSNAVTESGKYLQKTKEK
jgi:hypothetical protein